jgi:NAD(P)-dependent dehydrogenase (short-subunit alcohol dehydrogenase family)
MRRHDEFVGNEGAEKATVSKTAKKRDSPEPDALAYRIRCVADLEREGAEVLVLAADVACEADMQRVMGEIDARFGALHGVLHAAGVMAGGAIQRQPDADLRAILSPKVRERASSRRSRRGRISTFSCRASRSRRSSGDSASSPTEQPTAFSTLSRGTYEHALGFAERLMEATGGRGVDVVLNSLAGPFIERSLSVLAPGGRMVELGVRVARPGARDRGPHRPRDPHHDARPTQRRRHCRDHAVGLGARAGASSDRSDTRQEE